MAESCKPANCLRPPLVNNLRPQAETGIDGQRMQRIDHHRPQLHQLVPVTQLPQHFPTLPRITKERRKLVMHQQVQQQVGITAIVLLSPSRQPPDLSRITHQQLMAQLLHQLLEPVGVTTGFDADNHFPLKLTVEPLDVITLML